MQQLISKLGTYKGMPRARVWIEGERLRNAGFHAKQTRYTRTIGHDGNIPTIQLIANDAGSYRVSGKGDNPVIDITGKAVAKHFAGFENVAVLFDPGWITIRADV